MAVAFRRVAGALAFVKRHYLFIMRLGGVMLVAVGVLMVTGWWDALTVHLRVWVGNSGTVL